MQEAHINRKGYHWQNFVASGWKEATKNIFPSYKMPSPLRIAVLECDTPLDNVKTKYGGYGDIFEKLLQKAADGLNVSGLSAKEGLVVSKFHVVEKQEYPKLEDVDAILISGSKHDSFADDPWILKLVHFTQKVLAQSRVRIIGVCFGHQIVARAMGVKVGRSDQGWEIAVLPMQMTPKGKELFGKDEINIHQMHRDIVYSFPNGVESLGSSPRCEVQGMYAKGRLITVQGHPEFTEEIVAEICRVRHEGGIINDDIFNDAISRVANAHDGVLIAQTFLRFLLEE